MRELYTMIYSGRTYMHVSLTINILGLCLSTGGYEMCHSYFKIPL